VRGFRRLGVRVFGDDVVPPTRVYDAALEFELGRIARAIDRPHRDPSLRLVGLRPVLLPGQDGRVLDRAAAAGVVVNALAGLSRRPVALPVRVDRVSLRAAELRAAAAHLRRALSAPVRMQMRGASWWLSPAQLAQMLSLPHGAQHDVEIGGRGARSYFDQLRGAVDRPPRDADFAVTAANDVNVVPARDGRRLDVAATSRNVLRAALAERGRIANVVVDVTHPRRTTADARALGIRHLVAGYETIYGGDPNRIHNVQLVARLIDRHLIAPGAEFSFNRATGARTASRGFLEAPVIINGEVKTGLGGGVCQVSTTVFNAAYEAGLPITARTNHALYISHYPQGRDATVDYPSVDLRFVNDTGHWLLLRTFVGPSSLVVSLYGTPTHRRVVSETAPLQAHGSPPVERVPDPTLLAGEKVVESSGEPARTTSVRRRVYDADGKLIGDTTWYSSYRAEPAVVRVGTKQKPKPKPKKTTTTTTTTTTTATTTTTPAKTTRPPQP
jgi:vancomycin resistance protein YoaR